MAIKQLAFPMNLKWLSLCFYGVRYGMFQLLDCTVMIDADIVNLPFIMPYMNYIHLQ